jgi:hypothetical protein
LTPSHFSIHYIYPSEKGKVYDYFEKVPSVIWRVVLAGKYLHFPEIKKIGENCASMNR